MASRRREGFGGTIRPVGDPKGWMNPYPCQTCHVPYRSRIDLATHDCDPYGKKSGEKAAKVRQLTDEQVREIRRRNAEGTTLRQLAEEYGVGETTIGRVVRRERYADVE